MLKIMLDFDSTLFPTSERVLEIYNRRHDSNIELSQITTYDLGESLGSDIADELLELFCDKEVYENLQPYKGAIRAIKTLVEQGNEIYIATSTDIKNLGWKEQLLQKYFPFIPKDNLIRIHNKSLLNVDIMIEDNLENLTQTFADRVCFNQPWNQSKAIDFAYGIYRINCWDEIINTVRKIKKGNKEWEKE